MQSEQAPGQLDAWITTTVTCLTGALRKGRSLLVIGDSDDTLIHIARIRSARRTIMNEIEVSD